MKINRGAFALAGAAAVGACSTTPPIKVSHYLPKVETRVTITESVACDAENHIVAGAEATSVTAYSADITQAREIDLTGYGSMLADTGLTFTFENDGRLKTVNATSTGKASEIIKSAIGLVTTFAGARGFADLTAPQYKKECALLAAWGKGEPVTLTFAGPIDFAADASAQYIRPVPASLYRFGLIKNAVGYPCAKVTSRKMNPIVSGPEPTGAKVDLLQPSLADLAIHMNTSDQCIPADNVAFVHREQIVVPQGGKPYAIQIPKPVAFGKSTFVMEMAPSGSVTKLQYDDETGAVQVLDSASGLAGLLITSRAEETADANEEVARIKALNALVKCKADPANC